MGGKELAPVPMRQRGNGAPPMKQNNRYAIEKVLSADLFEIHYLEFEADTVKATVTNTKFRSTAQAVGRVTSTLQRFTSDDIKFAEISFATRDLQTATYKIDLQKTTSEQFGLALKVESSSILAIDTDAFEFTDNNKPLTWGIGPILPSAFQSRFTAKFRNGH